MEKDVSVRYVTEEEAGARWPEFEAAHGQEKDVSFDDKVWRVKKISKADQEGYLVAECYEVESV
jgi:hypothetical protein